MTALWHSFADMNETSSETEVVIARGEGAWVWDERGKRYLDGIAGLWYCNVGHGRRELIEAATAQMGRLAVYQTFGTFANRPALDLVDRLGELAPLDDPAVFFTNAGSDAIDTAAKLVRRYWNAIGRPERTVIVTRDRAYHGMNAFGTSLTGLDLLTEGYGGLVPDVVRIPHDDPAAFAAVLSARGDEVAAFLGEPVIGGGGVLPPRETYWESIRDLCDDHDVLLVADEVITGFGRLGTWFGSERFSIRPDIITCAKGLTSGYAPLGAVLAGAKVREPFWEGGAVFWQGYTYAGHPTSCAVALRNLRLIEEESLVARVREMGEVLSIRLRELEGHPMITEVRTSGLVAGVELTPEVMAEDPRAAQSVVAIALDRGLILRAIAGSVLQISPPFILTEDEISLLAATIGEALDEYSRSAHRRRPAVPDSRGSE